MEVSYGRNVFISYFIKYVIYPISAIIAFVSFGYHVNAQDFTSGTYYYNTNVVTDGLGIPTTYTSNTLSMGTTPLSFSNSSRTQAWVLRSDFYSFNYQFISGHSYRISTVYQMQPYSLNGNYDMRLVGANLRFTNQGNLTANYDGKVTVYNNGNSIDQTVQYSSMTYNDCSGNYCNWTNTFYFNATTNADSIAFTHGGNNIGVANKFMFYYPQNPSQYVPEMLTIGTAWVSIDDLGGGTDLDPLIQLEIESNSKLDSINNNIQQGNSKADDINSKLTSTNTILGTIQNGVESFKNAVNLQLGNVKSTLDYILSGMSSLLNKVIEGEKVCPDDVSITNVSVPSDYSYGYLDSTGQFVSNNNFATSPYISFKRGESFTIIPKNYSSSLTTRACIYDVNKNLNGCHHIQNVEQYSYTFNSFSGYIRFTSQLGNLPSTTFIGPCYNGNQTIFSRIKDIFDSIGHGLGNIVNAINGKIVDIYNDLFNADLQYGSDGTGVGAELEQIQQIPDTPISDLLLMPVNLINALYNALDTTNTRSSACTGYTIPFDFTGGNNTLTFPCFDGDRFFGSSLWGAIDILFYGFMVYNIGMMIVSFYESWSSLQDTFDSLYTPRHEYKGYQPKHGNSS